MDVHACWRLECGNYRSVSSYHWLKCLPILQPHWGKPCRERLKLWCYEITGVSICDKWPVFQRDYGIVDGGSFRSRRNITSSTLSGPRQTSFCVILLISPVCQFLSKWMKKITPRTEFIKCGPQHDTIVFTCYMSVVSYLLVPCSTEVIQADIWRKWC